MPLDDTWRRSVVFILNREGGEPVGTGFIIVVPNEANGPGRTGMFHAYVVTARHVIDNCPETGAIRLRTNQEGHAPHDYPLPGPWESADDDDVAAQQCDFRHFDPPVEFNALAFDEAMDRMPFDVRSGDQCYFIGLLELVPAMGRAMLPMVRSGTVGAYMQHGVPIKLNPPVTITAHLIDGWSLGGFSGSPCLAQTLVWGDDDERGRPSLHEMTRLIGIVIAHYDDTEKEAGVPLARRNTGVAIVLPVERIRALIEGDVLTKQRKDQAGEPDA